MSPTELTGFLTLGVLFVSAIVVPAWLRHRAQGTSEERQSVASWQGITTALQKERDALQDRLDSRDAAYDARLTLVRKEFEEEITKLKAKVAEQQARIISQGETIATLYEERGRRT